MSQQLLALAKRKSMALPPPESRVSIRGLWQFHEVRERFALKDPQSPQEIIDWFKGKNHIVGTPYGPQVWLDLCKLLGQEPLPYDEIPRGAKFKLQIEHWFLSSLAGDSALLNNGVMALFALEAGFNNSSEFKDPWNYTVKVEFFGKKNAQVQARYMNWANMTRNRNKPSLAFLHSAMCPADDITTAIYASSGLRNSGRTRQLTLSFESTAPVAKRARIEDITESVEEIDVETTDHAPVQESPSLNNELSVAMHVMAIEFANLERQFVEAMAHPTQTEASGSTDPVADSQTQVVRLNTYRWREDYFPVDVYIRASLGTRYVDTLDVFKVISKTDGAARVLHSKHLGKNKLENTARTHGFLPSDLKRVSWTEDIHGFIGSPDSKVQWNNPKGDGRSALPLDVLVKIIAVCQSQMAAKILPDLKTFLDKAPPQ